MIEPSAQAIGPVVIAEQEAASVRNPRTHELALLLGSRCRKCAERLPGGVALRGGSCPLCGEPTLPSQSEQSELLTALSNQATSRFWLAAFTAGGASLLVGWFPLLSTLLLGGSMLWISITIVRPNSSLLSPARRMVSRWTLRVSAGIYFAVSFIFLEVLTIIPLFGVLVKSVGLFGQVAFAGWFAKTYLGWQASREARRLPIGVGEYVFLAMAVGLIVGSMIAVVAFVLWGLGKIEWLQNLLVHGGTA